MTIIHHCAFNKTTKNRATLYKTSIPTKGKLSLGDNWGVKSLRNTQFENKHINKSIKRAIRAYHK